MSIRFPFYWRLLSDLSTGYLNNATWLSMKVKRVIISMERFVYIGFIHNGILTLSQPNLWIIILPLTIKQISNRFWNISIARIETNHRVLKTPKQLDSCHHVEIISTRSPALGDNLAKLNDKNGYQVVWLQWYLQNFNENHLVIMLLNKITKFEEGRCCHVSIFTAVKFHFC